MSGGLWLSPVRTEQCVVCGAGLLLDRHAADLRRANLSEVNLLRVFFSDPTWPELALVSSLAGAAMPDGTVHE